MIPEEVKKEAEKIQIFKFRGVDFVNWEKEIKYWHDTFFSVPFRIHFVYGPKCCGKTTLLEKVRDDILANKNLRKRKGKKVVIVVDELQVLKDIYIYK